MGLLLICAGKSTALYRCEDLNHGGLGQTNLGLGGHGDCFVRPRNDNLSPQLTEELAHCVPRGDMGQITLRASPIFFFNFCVDKVKREGLKFG